MAGAAAATVPSTRQRLEALEQSHEIIFHHYELGLAFISVLLTLVGILFPIVIYFTTILPTKREVEKVVDLENRLEDKFNKFLESVEVRRFNLLLEKATGADPDARRDAAMRLTLEDTTWLTEQQIAALCAAIALEKDLSIRSQLTHAALSKRTRHGDQIVREIMSDGSNVLLGRALWYIAHNPTPELEGLVRQRLENAEDRVQAATQILGGAVTYHDAMTFLLSLPVWRTALSRADRVRSLTTLNAWMTSGFLSKDDVRSSTWADAMGTRVLFLKVVGGKVVYLDVPDGALSAQIFEDGVIQRTVSPQEAEFAVFAERAKAAATLGPEVG
jgi:hypothetical protein